ncbi:type II secretion system protein [Vibrio intestinalis]|uniref:type II secretion system protein n=1 Tax=Vibrio intestinalis TaxID=2933291 RepID=UPI0021A4CB59|nr:type II secretion system protein [Vibrio intestinalis]
MTFQKSQGFTLVELIVVIILLAIVSVYAASRYIGIGSFSAFAIQENAISVIRQVQLTRMQSNSDVTAGLNDLTLQISADCIGSTLACSERSEMSSNWISDDNVVFSSSVPQVQFDLLGNPNITSPLEITISDKTGASSTSVTICPNGLVSSSGCL